MEYDSLRNLLLYRKDINIEQLVRMFASKFKEKSTDILDKILNYKAFELVKDIIDTHSDSGQTLKETILMDTDIAVDDETTAEDILAEVSSEGYFEQYSKYRKLLIYKILLLTNEVVSVDDLADFSNDQIEKLGDMFYGDSANFPVYTIKTVTSLLTDVFYGLTDKLSYGSKNNIESEFNRIYLSAAIKITKKYGQNKLKVSISTINGTVVHITDNIMSYYDSELEPNANFYLRINNEPALIEKHVGFFSFLLNYYKGLYSLEQNNIDSELLDLAYFKVFKSESGLLDEFSEEDIMIYSEFLMQLLNDLRYGTIN